MELMLLAFIFANVSGDVFALLCSDVREAPLQKKFNLYDIGLLSPQEIVKCVSHLGREKLGDEESKYIWRELVKYYDGVQNIPEEKLAQLHWISVAVEPNEVYNLTITNLDVVSNFGRPYKQSPNQLIALAEKVKEDWIGKEPEDYTYYDLVALRQILCYFNRSEIERIHPKAYKEAAMTIGELDECSVDVLQGFATLAIDEKAFGSPKKWDLNTITIIGTVVNGLPPQYSGIKSKKTAFHSSANLTESIMFSLFISSRNSSIRSD